MISCFHLINTRLTCWCWNEQVHSWKRCLADFRLQSVPEESNVLLSFVNICFFAADLRSCHSISSVLRFGLLDNISAEKEEERPCFSRASAAGLTCSQLTLENFGVPVLLNETRASDHAWSLCRGGELVNVHRPWTPQQKHLIWTVVHTICRFLESRFF